MVSMNSSYQAPFSLEDRSSNTSTGQLTTYRSIFRDYSTSSRYKCQQRSIREIDPATLLALELYIYLITYTPLTHDDVCVTIFLIFRDVDWEMLAIFDEARDLRVPNIYDEDDSVEQEDLWFQIRGLPDERITSSFNDLMFRLDDMGFSVAGILRPQMGGRTWIVVLEERGLPVEKQPALVHSSFDIDPTAIIDESQVNPYRIIWVPPAPRLVGFLDNAIEEAPLDLVSDDYIEVYDMAREGGDEGYYDFEDGNDEALARALELSRKEF